MTPQTHSHRACPDFEQLAAFVDGQLAGAERRQVIEHLETCPDCWDVYSEVLRFQEEEEEEEAAEPAQPTAPIGDESEDAAELATVLDHPRRWPIWQLAAAAALVLGVGLTIWFALAPFDLHSGRMIEKIDAQGALAELETDILNDLGWPTDRSFQSSAKQKLSEDAYAFQLGVAQVMTVASLRAQDNRATKRAIREMLALLQARDDRAPMQIALYGDLESNLSLELAIRAGESVDDWASYALESSSAYDLGKWTATAWLATLSDQPAFFNRSFRRALRESLKTDVFSEMPNARENTESIEKLLVEDPLDLRALRSALRDLMAFGGGVLDLDLELNLED